MIISHKYKYIFIKTNKTAGTSIEIALSKFCGDTDIITPISPNDEETRKRLGYRGPQNYLSPLRDYGIKNIATLLLKGERKYRYFNHISAEDIKTYIGDEIWNNYYKFCFERNPWDRVISLYYWRYRSEPKPTITEFLESDVPLALKNKGSRLYTIDGKVVVDKVYRFENLAEELETVRKLLGIPDKLDLPMAKSSFRKDKRNYREILNDTQKEIVARIFRDEIRLFGYEF